MPNDPPPGGASVSRRAIADIVRAATLGSYGVTGFASTPSDRLLAWLGIGHAGISIDLDGADLSLELDIEIAYGLPVAEVARQVDSAVRYTIRRAVGRDVADLRLHVGGLVVHPGVEPSLSADAATSPRPRRLRKTPPTAPTEATEISTGPAEDRPADHPAEGPR